MHPNAPLIVNEVLRSPGTPLDADARSYFEAQFPARDRPVLRPPALAGRLVPSEPGDQIEREAEAIATELTNASLGASGLRARSRANHDFGRVRVHTGDAADTAANFMGPPPFAPREHLVFRPPENP